MGIFHEAKKLLAFNCAYHYNVREKLPAEEEENEKH